MLARVVEADLYALFDLAEVDGQEHYDTVTVSGDRAIVTDWRRMVPGAPAVGPWRATAPGRWAGRFASGLEGGLERRMLDGELEGWNRYYLPLGLRHQRRVLLYDRDRFVGWLGAIRCADRPAFSHDEDDALARALPRLARAVRTEAATRAARAAGGSFVTEADGTVEWATDDARRWLHDHEGTVRALASDGEGHLWVIGGAVVTRSRLVSARGSDERWLWSLRPTERPTRDVASYLTPRQRDVAVAAAGGATIRQIAASLDIGDETARAHLKAVYALLGVRTRVELATLLHGRRK
jgi:DNA-binding CsgD family transcriptional regulator